MSDPSDKAVEAAATAELGANSSTGSAAAWRGAGEITRDRFREVAALGLTAAHDPALGLDRSVCLRDVVDLLIANGAPDFAGGYRDAAKVIERKFGGQS